MPETRKPKSAPSSQLEPGTMLMERYYIVRRVGGGGMGSVYQARDKRLADRLCAVKEMIELFADENQRVKAVDDFKREAEVLSLLEHPSIPTIYDYFIESGRYYLVMKWIGGGDLAEQMRIRGGTVDELTVSRWSIQICDVLHYIHSQKPPIIYRDLKPANLMLDDRTGRVMLVDFGIARIVRPNEKGVTAIGTMGYAPPELFAGKVEPRSDIYSLGATMFHMLTGADPQDNPLLIFDFSKNPKPCEINPAISPEMERVLMTSVSHKPEDRQASALDFKHELEELVRKPQLGSGFASAYAAESYMAAEPVQPRVDTPQAPVSQPAQQASIPSDPGASWAFCGHCGKKIAMDDIYCPHCGHRQPIAGSSGQPALATVPNTPVRATAQLVVIGMSDRPAPFRIEKDSILIGRTDPHTGIFPEVDLTRYDPETKVSRKHARIYRMGEQFFVEDLNSVNGTIVNSITGGSIRLNPKAPRVLAAGDELKLGETTLKFLIG